MKIRFLLQRKILLLYLHIEHDPFSKDFLEHLQKPDIRQLLGRRFCLLGWDIQNREYQSALVEALDSYDLDVISKLVESKHSAALFILPVGGCISVYACLKSKFFPDDFTCYIENTTRALLEDIEEETKEQNRLMENKNLGEYSVTCAIFLIGTKTLLVNCVFIFDSLYRIYILNIAAIQSLTFEYYYTLSRHQLIKSRLAFMFVVCFMKHLNR